MFYINVVLRVHEESKANEITDLLRKAGQLSRLEPGCLRFEVYHDNNDPQNLLLCEHWENKEAWEVHKHAEAFTTIYQPLVLPHVDRTPYFCSIVE
ncbi:antibiotic biosynthesis monooxygenase family protein [Rubinisphaera sp.]|uniref:putative quinol monooxygenase n=1 Tax=Rubinisphaera sp. TaxID=2024857 RepID=UPI000C0C6719|nr:antibiotic biosynthesis monooxygenase family protein [Rubinisphaera sp.]MBV10992.1 antibiotic biosynthesis monooxygenase [Rubinisphaera sp.]HCS53324.1 antibiotic biosynthesis monooxygenase [Planctomycetaceae bacterium]|tara:strand:- start:8518 stop:8805 length:288 start_codon:yes stop_codon:yes gene_type:complete